MSQERQERLDLGEASNWADRARRSSPSRYVIEEALEAAYRSRTIRMARTQLGLSQVEFAERFRVPVGTLRDWEQACVTPPEFAVAYAKVIAKHPDMVADVLA